MKCPVCNGAMERNKDVIRQDGVEFEAYRCVKCGEELMTMPQLRSLAAKYRRLRNARQVTFAKWGNSIAVRIPSDVAEECGISEGRQGLLTRDKQGIRIMPSG